jgi:hypothetical protein
VKGKERKGRKGKEGKGRERKERKGREGVKEGSERRKEGRK